MNGLKMKYFVLKPEGKDKYAKASREAMREYARIIDSENHLLANDLYDWVNRETDGIVKSDEIDIERITKEQLMFAINQLPINQISDIGKFCFSLLETMSSDS